MASVVICEWEELSSYTQERSETRDSRWEHASCRKWHYHWFTEDRQVEIGTQEVESSSQRETGKKNTQR